MSIGLSATASVRWQGKADRRLVIAALGLSQIIGYGTLYYAFSVLAPGIATDLNWSREWVFGALSIALLAGGFISPWVGKWMDRYGAGRIMTFGSIAAAAALAGCALAPEKATFVAGLIAIELASTFVQYGAAFALLVQIDDERAPMNITYLTLIGGFASTILWPITAALQEYLSWREVYLVYALVNLLICTPIHFWLSTLSRPKGEDRAARSRDSGGNHVAGVLPVARRRGAFILMAIGFSLLSFINAATLVHMLPTLGALGLGAMGVVVSTLFGPAQVASRLTNMLFGKELRAPTLAIIAATFEPLAIAILMTSAPWIPGALAFSIIFGLGSGLSSIINGTLPLYLFGKDGYGELTGRIAAIRLTVTATAPFIYALLMENLGVTPALGFMVVLGICAIGIFLFIGRLTATAAKAPTERVTADAR